MLLNADQLLSKRESLVFVSFFAAVISSMCQMQSAST
uniref:Uncharacterized protein n=1 Tax=Rhizophora mucronata TaxID=61149 RepID=A0A2P2QLD6_RHIMU